MKNRITAIVLIITANFIVYTRTVFADSKKLTIIFSGDMRGEIENCHCPKEDFGGLPRRGNYIDSVRKKVGEILLLDTGDVISLATADSDKKEIADKASISFKAMGIMGYDVINIGESDLIFGEDFLKKIQSAGSFPLISANIISKATDKPFTKPYVIKTMKNGLKVGILGLVNERYIINSDDLDIYPNKDIAEEYINELRPNSDIVIVLGHLGLPYAEEIAKSVPGIDVVLSGHWDVENQEPVKIGSTLVMPSTYYSRKIGRLDLKIEQGVVRSYTWESTALDSQYDGNKELETLISEVNSY